MLGVPEAADSCLFAVAHRARVLLDLWLSLVAMLQEGAPESLSLLSAKEVMLLEAMPNFLAEVPLPKAELEETSLLLLVSVKTRTVRMAETVAS